MLVHKGYVLVRKREAEPGKESGEAIIFGQKEETLDSNPLIFVPFSNVSEARAKFNLLIKGGFWNPAENIRHFIAELELEIGQNQIDQNPLLQNGPHVVFWKAAFAKFHGWSVAGESDSNFLQSLKPYGYANNAMHKVIEVRNQRGRAILAHCRLRVIWDSRLDSISTSTRNTG